MATIPDHQDIIGKAKRCAEICTVLELSIQELMVWLDTVVWMYEMWKMLFKQ